MPRRHPSAQHRLREPAVPAGCSAFRGLVFELVDGELDEGTEVAMTRHARECPRCLGVLRAAVQLGAAVQRSELPEPAPRQLRVRIAQLMADAAIAAGPARR
jgi:hypothetical protein